MLSPFTPLKTSPSANKNNSSGDSCQWFCNVLCETKCPESSNKCCAQRQADAGSKKWWSLVIASLQIPLLWEEKLQTALATKMKVCSEECAAICQLSMACGAGQDGSRSTGESTKHQELSSAAFPTCLASTGGGVNKDLLEEYKKGPPGAITLGLPFQVLSINMVPQSNPAGTL